MRRLSILSSLPFPSHCRQIPTGSGDPSRRRPLPRHQHVLYRFHGAELPNRNPHNKPKPYNSGARPPRSSDGEFFSGRQLLTWMAIAASRLRLSVLATATSPLAGAAGCGLAVAERGRGRSGHAGSHRGSQPDHDV